MSNNVYDLLAKISWDTNAKELEKTIDLSRQQSKMLEELRLKGYRLEQQIVKTNDPAKLKKYNDQLQETRKRADAITTAHKNQAAQVDVLKKKQQEFFEKLRQANDPKIVQGLLRGLHQVENQLEFINRQATDLPQRVGGIGRELLSGFAGGLVGGGIVGIIGMATHAISGLFSTSIDEASEAEQGLLRFRQTLDNLGKGDLFDGLVKDADRLAKTYKNLFDNDDILAGQAKFIEGTRVTEKQLRELTPVAIELAAKLGIDVVNASELLTNAIIGRTSPELKRLGLNMKGLGTETSRVNEITGDFAKLLEGSVDVALQTVSGRAKQLNQELKNLEEDLGKKLLPLQKRLTEFKIGLVNIINSSLETDDEFRQRQIDGMGAGYLERFKKLDKKQLQEEVKANYERGKNLSYVYQAITNDQIRLEKFMQGKLSAEEGIAIKERIKKNQKILEEGTKNATARQLALNELLAKKKKESDEAINKNAGADDPTEKSKGETPEARAARLKREQEESDRIIREAKLSLLDEEAREIAVRTQKHEEDAKKLRRVSVAERLAFEQAFYDDLSDIHTKYNLKELERIDKQVEAIDKKVEEDFRRDVTEGAKNQQLQLDTQKEFDKEIEEVEKDARERKKEADKKAKQEEIANQKLLISNFKDLLDAGQLLLDADIKRTERQIELQQDRVDAAKKSSTASLKIEEDRMNALLEKRRKFERDQRIIDAGVIIANQAVAASSAIVGIASAVKSGNAVLIAANVVAVLAALTAGYAAVRSINADAGFYEGGYTGDGNPREESTAQGNRGYKYHKGEYVMNERLTKKHRPMFEGIHKGELMVQQMGDKYLLAPSINVDTAVSEHNAAKALGNFEFTAMANELSEIKGFLKNLNLNVHNNLDAGGFSQHIAGELNQITIKNLMRK